MNNKTQHHHNDMKRSQSSNSDAHSYMDSPHSPLRFHSPLRSDLGDTPESPPYYSPEKPPPDNSKAIVTVNKLPWEKKPAPAPAPATAMKMVMNRSAKEEQASGVRKVEGSGEGGGDGGEEGRRARARARTAAVAEVLGQLRKDERVTTAGLGFRISEVVLCLVSFSVMAADKTQGWSGDSFDRYKEYRYCLAMNVIGFVYATFQAYDLAYYTMSGKHAIRHHLRHHFDFFMDQVIAYLLISASSSAATRVDDWQSNWGKDEFTIMASASIAMSFLAFVAFAFSSLISGYNLSTRQAR